MTSACATASDTAAARLIVTHEPALYAFGMRYACTLGRSGFSSTKREGDGATPLGCFPIIEGYYRADRLECPRTALPMHAITPEMGWCDDPQRVEYNQRVSLPFAGSHEQLWREDHCYDFFLVIGYNTPHTKAGAGSAIFIHLPHDDGRTTAGCIALQKDALLALLPHLSTQTTIELGVNAPINYHP
ncbi:MAG: L,D-transpeptidase family protein [Rickettsiales bacterium]|nr:L,D-transpeptidase family protein [Rickettsiales bacterium]